jgi:8-oxo-dGTP pyrophosphatase MutT (NUDIX family)
VSALRALVREQVVSRTPVDQREEHSIERFVELYDRLDDPFREDADPIHVTGSALVVGRRGIVLHLHRRLGIWIQPGGHVDPGETPWEAAGREAREETGLDVELLEAGADSVPALAHVDVHPGGRGHTHLDLRFLVGGSDADPDPPPHESQEVHWFGWDAAIARADPGLRGWLEMQRSRCSGV